MFGMLFVKGDSIDVYAFKVKTETYPTKVTIQYYDLKLLIIVSSYVYLYILILQTGIEFFREVIKKV